MVIKKIDRLLMALQASLLLIGLMLLYASGKSYWNIERSGIPEIVDLKTLYATSSEYARVTAKLKDTGIHIPKDEHDSESYFYVIELEDKLVLIESLHKQKEGRAHTFFVRPHPYEGTHVETYFSVLAAASGRSVHDVRAEYADTMLQYFEDNPKTYNTILLLIGALLFGSGALWTIKARNGKAMIRAIFTFKDDDEQEER